MKFWKREYPRKEGVSSFREDTFNQEVKMDEQNLNINEMLDNKAQISDKEKKFADVKYIKKTKQNRNEEIYRNVFHGNGFDKNELMQFSLKTPINMVMVAGPYASGKTTLIVMMYHLFREGKNEKLLFRGSKTMRGFWKRSEKLMQYSANEKPEVDRTPMGASDNFLHLALVNSEGEEKDLIFADISGEIFSEKEYMKELKEIFSDIENMIVIIDIEKIQDSSKRRITVHDTIVLLSNLLKHHILSKSTKLQIVCTKMDSVKEREDLYECQEYVRKFYSQIKPLIKDKLGELYLHFVSALELEDKEECKHLEEIIENCTQKCTVYMEETKKGGFDHIVREFDKFGLRR